MAGAGAVVVPSAAVLAIVRHADPPAQAPAALAPYVVRDDDDWSLTEDALAFGEPSIAPRFGDWRSRWERTWVLDPYTSLHRLLVVAREPAPGGVLDRAALRRMEDATGWTVSGERLAALRDQLDRAAAVLRAQPTEGYGFVDATPGRARAGLARTWSPAAGRELLAADRHLAVRMEPETGLVVEATGAHGGARVVVAGVERVLVDADAGVVAVAGGDATVVRLALDAALPLGWLVPGSIDWRVRRVPHVVVWARTLAGLAECCRYAEAIARPVRLTTHRPFA